MYGARYDQNNVDVLMKLIAGSVPFTGMRKRVQTTGLQKDAFTSLAAGQSIELSIDMATVHDLSVGGSFKVSSFGAIPYADVNSTTLVPGRALAYTSNELDITVDGAAAAKVPRAFNHEVKRTELQSSSCSSSQKSSLTSALKYCQQLASAAATQAQSGSATKFKEYFKTTSSSTRGVVAARLKAVASECASTTSGKTTYVLPLRSVENWDGIIEVIRFFGYSGLKRNASMILSRRDIEKEMLI
jgi:deuterolysin